MPEKSGSIQNREQLRIAITVDPEYPVPPENYGGVERIVHSLVRNLVARGHDVTLFAHPDSQPGCRLVPFPGRSSHSILDTLRNAAMLRRYVVREGYDLIHSHSRLQYLLPVLGRRIPKLMTYHRHITPRSVRLGTALARGTLAFSAVGRHLIGELGELAQWFVVHNGIDVDRYRFNPEVSQEAPLVFLGRVEYIKGPHLAIEVSRRTGRRLVIAGNLPDGEKHQRYFDQEVRPHLDNDRVRYVGPVNDEQKSELLSSCAALLMPVLWEEPFGMVMAEALACGTPVIGLKRGAVPEVVKDGMTGFVCRDVPEMAQAVKRLATIDRMLCRREVVENFSEKVMTDRYEMAYRSMLEKM